MDKSVSYLKRLNWIAALLLPMLAAGCGGGGGGRDTILGAGGVGVIVAPTVTAVAPANLATNVAINTKVVVANFSTAMNPDTLTAPGTFTLACPAGTPVPGAATYIGAGNLSRLALTLPAAGLPPNTVCTGTVTTAAKDTAGTAMSRDFVWTFTTGVSVDTTAPQVIATAAYGTTGFTTIDVTRPAFTGSGLPSNRNSTASFSKSMDPATMTAANVSVTCAALPVQPACVNPVGVVSYAVSGNTVTFNPNGDLGAFTYTSTITTGATDLAGNPLAAPYSWTWSTSGIRDTIAPTVTLTSPADLATNVATGTTISAVFSEEMKQATINTANYFVKETLSNVAIAGTISYDVVLHVATFVPVNTLKASTKYTVTVTNAATDLANNALVVPAVNGLPKPNPWTFTTAAGAVPPITPLILGTAARYGTFGGSAGMTNKGIQTLISGAGGNTADIGTIATGTSAVTGFQDSALDVYTVVPGVDQGMVTGKIYTCTTSTTGPTNPTNGVNAASCAIATQARLDAQQAYLTLKGMPTTGLAAPANLAGLTLAPGVYQAPSGSFSITGGVDLTLDGNGDANSVWVFQMASSLTVGASGAPRSVSLINGAQAKNVFWQVGSAATINPGGGGTMVGTIISQAGAAFSTVGSVIPVTLNGRAVSLGASVTLVNTVINVPAP